MSGQKSQGMVTVNVGSREGRVSGQQMF